MSDELAPVKLLEMLRQQTPARILAGHSGLSYRTAMQLALRRDHAAALDAVRQELDPLRDLGSEFLAAWKLYEVQTLAGSKEEFLLRPDLGRRLSDDARQAILERCFPQADLQIAIGDGLSAAAVNSQIPELLPLLAQGAKERGWSFGRPVLIRYCRVGVMNDLAICCNRGVLVLLVGERPGFAAAESLSAYLAWRPRAGHNDANRNVISNIHAAGLPVSLAAPRIPAFTEQLRQCETSGVAVKERLSDIASLPS